MEILDHDLLEAQRQEHRMTETSFAVLGLLAMRDWTTYELAQQMQRSFSYFWPRAERRIYDEPRRLSAAGWVESTREKVGRRPRTVWTITDRGRAALRAWLAEPPNSEPTLEFEGMLKVFLAPYGAKRDLLSTLREIERASHERGRQLSAMSAEIAVDGGQFPERIHVNALAMRYMIQIAALTERWAQQSQEVVEDWRSPATPGATAREESRATFASLAGEPTVPEGLRSAQPRP